MKRQPKKSAPRAEEFAVWTFAQAGRAVPFVSSVMRSIRELYLDEQGRRHFVRKLEARSGRPDRHTIILQEDAKREADRLQGEIALAAQELASLNIHCVDPVNGVAMIPFAQREKLAWLVFDLFGEQTGITSWRYHDDPLTQRRPLEDIDHQPMPTSIAV